MHFDQLRSLRLFNEILGKNPQMFSEEFKTSFEFQNSRCRFEARPVLDIRWGFFYFISGFVIISPLRGSDRTSFDLDSPIDTRGQL